MRCDIRQNWSRRFQGLQQESGEAPLPPTCFLASDPPERLRPLRAEPTWKTEFKHLLCGRRLSPETVWWGGWTLLQHHAVTIVTSQYNTTDLWTLFIHFPPEKSCESHLCYANMPHLSTQHYLVDRKVTSFCYPSTRKASSEITS